MMKAYCKKSTDVTKIDFQKLFRLDDRVVVITGGMGLIGKAFVEICAQYGANIVILDISNKKPEEFAKTLEDRFKREMLGISVDVSIRKEVASALDTILKKFKSVSDIVNCHYKTTKNFKRFEDLIDTDWDESIQINLKGTFLTCQIIGGWMSAHGGGNIVNIPSLYSVVAPNQNLYRDSNLGSPAAYGASKGGIMALSNYLATYWAKKGVRVNQLTPHGVWNNHEKAFDDRFSDFLPMGRMSCNHEVAGALLYLLSDASSFVTGHNLIVDGGWSTW